jgi:hypothetical protein
MASWGQAKASDRLFSDRQYLGISAALALAVLIYIMAFGVNIPYWDDWEFVTLLKAFNTGDHWVAKLYAQHNEHRFLFPKIIFLALAKLTAWNVKVEMVAGWVVSCAGFYVVWLMMKRSGVRNGLYMLLVPCIYFNLGQWENILWGWQVTLYMMLFFVLAATYFLSGVPDKPANLLPAALAGCGASFSFMNGLLVWPVGLLQILLTPDARPKKLKHSVIWAVSGAIIWALYFRGYVSPSQHPDVFTFLHEPVSLALYFFANTGSMLGIRTEQLAVAAGAVLSGAFFLFAYLHYTGGGMARMVPWFSIGIFSMVSSLAIAVGRLGFGIRQALEPRYTTITALLVIAVLVMGSSAREHGYIVWRGGIMKYLSFACMTALILGIASYYAYGVLWGYKAYKTRTAGMQYLLSYKTAPDEGLEIIYPFPDILRERADYLKEHRLSVFR